MGPFEAHFSDGKTAASTPVEVVFAMDGLTINMRSDALIHQWDYKELTSVGPVVPGEFCQISSRSHPGAILITGDQNFVHALLEKSPHMSAEAEGRRLLKTIFSFMAAAILVGALFWYLDPSISRSIAGAMPDELRKGLGEHVVKSLARGKAMCRAPEGVAALNKMVKRLQAGTDAKWDFDIKVAQLGVVNAFAAPGEKIVVSGSLVKFVKSPEELAGVIAHEMGHGLELHPEAGIVRAIGISAGLQLLMGGSAGQLGEMGALLLQLRYTRSAEREADAHAIRILRDAEIRAKPFSEFFARLNKRFGGSRVAKSKDTAATKSDKKGATSKGDNTGAKGEETINDMLRLFSTHPPLPERAENIRKIKSWASRPILSDGEWQALRNICD